MGVGLEKWREKGRRVEGTGKGRRKEGREGERGGGREGGRG